VVGHIAHEIKNPLVSIKTFVELLDERYEDPEFRRHFLNIVERDVQALDSIAEKLIDFSRKIHYRFEYGDINIIIKKCIFSLISRTRYPPEYSLEDPNEKNAFKPSISNINFACDENLPLVEFDREKLEKSLTYILFHLMSNTERDGKMIISSNIGQSEACGKFIRIIMTGVGCRLSDTELNQLFDPFNMEQSNLIDVGPSIAQKIIEEHGGHLDVRRERDGNVTFVISLPISR
jgi:polar amino acid transport system substrate-binding protein